MAASGDRGAKGGAGGAVRVKKIEDWGDLSEAEAGLIAHLRAGTAGEFWASDSLPPENAPPELHIRTSLIRALLLGQVEDVPVPERGLEICGALLRGDGEGETTGLDLEGVRAERSLSLHSCNIPDLLLLNNARLPTLNLSGSFLPRGLSAGGLVADESIFLRNVIACDAVNLVGAKAGGDLDCKSARLRGARITSRYSELMNGEEVYDVALIADGLEVGGNVVLIGTLAFGEIGLAGAKIGCHLDCRGSKLEGQDRALNADSAQIGGSWFWDNDAAAKGVVDLTAAKIGTICDEPSCWPSEIFLNRCRYGGFGGKGVSGAERIRWLNLVRPQELGYDFWPQPYEECARALREAGHGNDARDILIEKEKLQRAARRHVLWRAIHHRRDEMARATRFRERAFAVNEWIANILALTHRAWVIGCWGWLSLMGADRYRRWCRCCLSFGSAQSSFKLQRFLARSSPTCPRSSGRRNGSAVLRRRVRPCRIPCQKSPAAPCPAKTG